MKHHLLTGLACLALGGSAVAVVPSAAVAAPAHATPSAWKVFVKAAVDRNFALDPAFAVYEGAHQYDGKLPDWSEAGLRRTADFYRSTIARASAFTGLSAADAFERDYLVAVMRGKLFWIEDADQPHTNVAFYVGGGLDPNVYVSRSYTDKASRMKAMIAFFDGIPAATAQIRANLKTPMPRSFVSYGVAAFAGFADYYRGDARAAFADVKSPALQARFKASSEKAGVAMQALADWLKAQDATATSDFALGPDRFARMLQATELVDTPLDQLEAVAKADLRRNQDAVKEVCAQYAPGQTIAACFAKMSADKPADGPVAEARREIPELATFVRTHDILTIPTPKMADVQESPPYNRANSAYMDPPGPLEKGATSVYYISPPDPTWSREKQLDYVPGKADLLFTTVHEVMPGHYLQFLHSNKSPSIVGQLYVGYGFAEGWAHYTEQMMWDAGLGHGDLETHLGQLSNALLRDCRFLSAIGLHARGMTEAQSKQLFMDQCWTDEGNAEQQAARGTYDPAYLNYTLSKLQIIKLREDWTATPGGRAGWKAFHDQFLNYGGPPVPLIRQAMLKEAAPHAQF